MNLLGQPLKILKLLWGMVMVISGTFWLFLYLTWGTIPQPQLEIIFWGFRIFIITVMMGLLIKREAFYRFYEKRKWLFWMLGLVGVLGWIALLISGLQFLF